MPGTGQHRRRQRRLEGVQGGNRRIYDPRRWHKKSSTHGNKNAGNWGQPPAGWMLVWAGRFKRWRRRWFVAHPPGLLLHYKNGDQIGRPGCISLLGATASPTPGKERQMKIVRGSMVYYLRTINKDYRQPWLDAIDESMRIYNKSVQKAAVGAMPGRALLPQESVPEHVREEWEAQERELNRRLAERMQDLEPSSQAFLQQLQALQQSLSVISGALGFTERADTRFPSISTGEAERRDTKDTTLVRTEKADGTLFRRSPAVSGDEAHQRSSSELGGNDFSQNGKHYISSSVSLPDFSFHRTQRSIFKWKSDGESKQGKKRSSKSAPSASLSGEKSMPRSKRRSFSLNLDESLRNSDYSFLPQGSCIGGECFKWKKKTSTSGIVEIEQLINTEVESRTHSNGVRSPLVGEKKENVEEVESHTIPCRELGETADGSIEGDISAQHKDPKSWGSKAAVDGSEPPVGTNDVGESEKQASSVAPILSLSSEKSGPVIKGPLHAAWHRMHEAFAEALKVEIHRALELEAENAVLQESLASLPQLKKDHKDLLESLQNSGTFENGKSRTSASRSAEDEEGHDSEDEIAIEYFEALEVLNQHEFISRSTPAEESDGYSDRDDAAHEPPEEGDVPIDGELLSEAEGDDLDQPRNRLPAPRPLSRGFSLWTVLKNAIGKDLNHITMPATINEPLSVLQKCAEEMQYRYLLERAAEEESSVRRLLHVSAFACASYHGSIYRDAKPFNPMLGETYEWLAPDEKSWFLTEQVSHHPPIMAFHSESVLGDYKIYGEIEIKNKFWGKSVEVLPTGVCHLRYAKNGDHITWGKVTTCAHNVVVGKLWIDNYGELVIKNHTTGDLSRIRFHKAGSKDRCRITGKIYDGKGVPQYSIHGNYEDQIFATREDAEHEGSGPVEELIWKKPAQIEDFHQQYCFSKFSIGLNELTTKLAESLPPTDSRFRPDQRALEDGDLEKATPEKLRLEDKQRQARKQRKERGEDWKCLWFNQRVPGVWQVKTGDNGEEPSWIYQGKYWEMREKQNWQECPDIM
ncbi:unnamed protein product [Calypogeia fissa]